MRISSSISTTSTRSCPTDCVFNKNHDITRSGNGLLRLRFSFPPAERHSSCTHQHVSPPCTFATHPVGLVRFALAVRSPPRKSTPNLREQEIVLQRHTAAISTSNENVAGHALLPDETQQALETGYDIEMRVVGPHHDRARAQSRCVTVSTSPAFMKYDV